MGDYYGYNYQPSYQPTYGQSYSPRTNFLDSILKRFTIENIMIVAFLVIIALLIFIIYKLYSVERASYAAYRQKDIKLLTNLHKKILDRLNGSTRKAPEVVRTNGNSGEYEPEIDENRYQVDVQEPKKYKCLTSREIDRN